MLLDRRQNMEPDRNTRNGHSLYVSCNKFVVNFRNLREVIGLQFKS